jgi:hypothetical protein
MAYYFYINSGIPTLATIEQFHSYYPSLTSFYQKNDDLFNNSGFGLPWIQTELPTQNDTVLSLTNAIFGEEGANVPTGGSLSTLK